MNPLILPALFYNEDVKQREKTLEMLGSDELVHSDEYDLLHIYTFSPPTISPCLGLKDKENVCNIFVDGTSFIVRLSPEQCLAKVIDWTKRNEYNKYPVVYKTDELSGWQTIHEPTKIQE